jgi:sRNA-binding regulator protein Hfq
LLRRAEQTAISAGRKHQEEMKAQIEKFDNYRITFESDKLVKI